MMSLNNTTMEKVVNWVSKASSGRVGVEESWIGSGLCCLGCYVESMEEVNRMLEYKETSIFCHQLVEYDGKHFILDASTMKPKLYYWGLPTEAITVEMMEVDKNVTIPGTHINKIKGGTAAIIVQPFVGVVYRLLKNLFSEYAISQQIFLKIVLFMVAMLISFFHRKGS